MSPQREERGGEASGDSDRSGIPSYLEPGTEPFDPLRITDLTLPFVCEGDGRKYTRFYCTGVYGGISTGYAVGCNLRCVFCWVGPSRDSPKKHGRMYSARETARTLLRNARKRGVRKIRISGGEPTLCRDHLVGVLDLTKDLNVLFILETNGILLGDDESYVEDLNRFSHFHLRLSLKAGNPGSWEKKTGAIEESFELPYRAVENLLRHRVSFHVAAMTDPRFMPAEERDEMLSLLEEAGYHDWIEEESCDPYNMTLFRLKKRGKLP